MNVPNTISLFRLCSVPVFIWMLSRQQLEWAFWLFGLAAVSDALDGIIAKHFNQRTKLGGFLDPLADKALLVSAFVMCAFIGLLPLWLVLLVVFRDLVIIAGAVVFETVTRSLQMEPLLISKLNTLTQICLIIAVLGHAISIVPYRHIVVLLQFAVAATTLTSGIAYIVIWSLRAQRHENRDGMT